MRCMRWAGSIEGICKRKLSMNQNQFQTEWQTTSNRFVAYFDILGFKNLVLHNTHAEMLERFDILLKVVNGMQTMNAIPMQPHPNNKSWTNGNIREFVFSDSIILFSEADDMNSALKIIIASAAVIIGSFAADLPLKGAIAHGEMTVDINRSLFYGKPLINSYLLHDELKMYGAIVHDSAEKKFDEYELLNSPMLLLHHTCPLKEASVKHYINNWVWLYDFLKFSKQRDAVNLPETKTFLAETIKDLYHSVSGSTRKYVDNTLLSIQLMEKLNSDPNTKAINEMILKTMK